jgi:hypothetical protein
VLGRAIICLGAEGAEKGDDVEKARRLAFGARSRVSVEGRARAKCRVEVTLDDIWGEQRHYEGVVVVTSTVS